MDSNSIYVYPQYEEYEFRSERNWRTDGQYEPFVYIIQEIETGMMYIGSKTAKGCLESDLGTKYFTSSKYINWVSDEFEIRKIYKCASNHDAMILEYILIDQNYAISSSMYYNKNHPYVGWGSTNQQGQQNNFYGKKHSTRTKAKMSKSLKGRNVWNKGHKEPNKTCTYCGKIGKGNIMNYWHFDNCKHKNTL